MDRAWVASGSSSWPKTKTKKSACKKKNSKRKTCSLPVVESAVSASTQLSPPVNRQKSAHCVLSSLRGQPSTVGPKSAHRGSTDSSSYHIPITKLLVRPSSAHSLSSAQTPISAHHRHVYYTSSFECLTDNLDMSRSESSHASASSSGGLDFSPRRIWTRSRKSKDVFPFEHLPTDCKLKVFSYFSAQEKGRLAIVCQEWSNLIRTSSLWKNVDFTEFSFACLPKTRHHTSDVGMHICYQCHRKRVHKFTKYLLRIRPLVTRLIYNYDIGDTGDGWLTMLYNFLDGVPCRELHYVHLKWKDTPMKPFGLEAMQLGENAETIVHRHRHRQRLFVNLFDKFTALAPNVETLVLPFDWSEKSIDCLTRLTSLHSLVLEKYFVFQRLDQSLLSRLVNGLPSLERLMLEVWTPSGRGLIKYHISSDSLKYLDISQSRGFYLQQIDMPNLLQFYVARHPWNGPLVTSDKVNLPCLHGVFTTGAPRLQKLNDHVLRPDWRFNLYPDLEEALKAVCSCRVHKPGWAM